MTRLFNDADVHDLANLIAMRDAETWITVDDLSPEDQSLAFREARAILHAVAPAIAARALREAAHAASIRSDIWGRHGADFLNAKADEIEGRK